jgi:very-short-patch-repair endonuclease
MAGGRREAAADLLVESPDLHSESERRLFLALSELGIPVRTKPIVEGYELDFAIDTASGSVDLEIDGIHHTDARGRQRRQDLARDQVLAGLGWTVIRVPAWRCLADAADTARQIADQLNGLSRRQ